MRLNKKLSACQLYDAMGLPSSLDGHAEKDIRDTLLRAKAIDNIDALAAGVKERLNEEMKEGGVIDAD